MIMVAEQDPGKQFFFAIFLGVGGSPSGRGRSEIYHVVLFSQVKYPDILIQGVLFARFVGWLKLLTYILTFGLRCAALC